MQYLTIPTPDVGNPGTVVIGGTTTTHPISSYAQVWTYYYLSLDATNGGWTQPGYNDSSWASGAGVLTNVPGTQTRPTGATDNPTALPNKPGGGVYSTFYFRTHFTYAGGDPSITTLTLTTDVDDGGFVYLNGHQVVNMHMSGTSATYTTLDNGWSNNDGSPTETWTFAGTYLVQGDNVLAVEVHQNNTSTHDVTWGAILDAVSIGPVDPRSTRSRPTWSPITATCESRRSCTRRPTATTTSTSSSRTSAPRRST